MRSLFQIMDRNEILKKSRLRRATKSSKSSVWHRRNPGLRHTHARADADRSFIWDRPYPKFEHDFEYIFFQIPCIGLGKFTNSIHLILLVPVCVRWYWSSGANDFRMQSEFAWGGASILPSCTAYILAQGWKSRCTHTPNFQPRVSRRGPISLVNPSIVECRLSTLKAL